MTAEMKNMLLVKLNRRNGTSCCHWRCLNRPLESVVVGSCNRLVEDVMVVGGCTCQKSLLLTGCCSMTRTGDVLMVLDTWLVQSVVPCASVAV